MMKQIHFFSIKNLLLLIVFIPYITNAQKIEIQLPSQANEGYAFLLNKGIRQDTIQKGVFSATGQTTILIPDKYRDYTGIGSLQTGGAAPFNMIINHESFAVEQDNGNKYVFKGSPENTYLYSIIQDQVMPVPDSTLYASRFVDMIRYSQSLRKINSQMIPNLMEKTNIRNYATNNLDLELLYTSGLWYEVVDGLLRLYGGQQALGENMVQILENIKSEEVFVHLVDNLITITEQYGWDDAFNIIIPYVESSGRIPVPQGKIYLAFALAKAREGIKAPEIEGLAKSLQQGASKYNLLVFYNPGCENCHVQIKQLIKKYTELKDRGVRIISISGGSDKLAFEQEQKEYPWEDKLCDFNGFSGKNFINFGIMGTPVFFLLDKEGYIVKRFAQVSELEPNINSIEEK
ncbi:hypothetical protein D0T84_04435 [Dysgonomonas sp. 521]|uniref:peroxiredoxin family protein n=1 Tax=Dysgonomonas sp. 521 TaxID=2302932 RepID=UPI0013D518E8|nr:thioredoxin family protein [Dysgonomonas sp. 521]NDV94165.1 hypothetical protein [Dysgonomonas sp. 521]